MEASLYVHVPFCSGTCDYCDFYSVPVLTEDPRLKRFVDIILAQTNELFETHKPSCVPSLYIGGGTPSVLGAHLTQKLLSGLLRTISRYSPPPQEITIEANPESADEGFLAAAKEGGATRLSLGVQSFHAASRRAVNRVGREHDGDFLRRRLALAADYFPNAFSGDLISGLPFQDECILLDDIAALINSKPSHISFYALTVENETPLAQARRLLTAPEEAERLWICGRDALEKSLYSQYEVSNFCLSGKESRHNTRYWRMLSWLALGPAGSATVINDETGTGFRYTIPAAIDAFLSTQEFQAVHENLSALTLIKETLLMGFRCTEGPDEDLFRRRFHVNITELIPDTLRAWKGRGLAEADKTVLTKAGLLFLDPFLIDAFKELDGSYSPC